MGDKIDGSIQVISEANGLLGAPGKPDLSELTEAKGSSEIELSYTVEYMHCAYWGAFVFQCLMVRRMLNAAFIDGTGMRRLHSRCMIVLISGFSKCRENCVLEKHILANL